MAETSLNGAAAFLNTEGEEIYTFTVNGRTVATSEDKKLIRFLRDDLRRGNGR